MTRGTLALIIDTSNLLPLSEYFGKVSLPMKERVNLLKKEIRYFVSIRLMRLPFVDLVFSFLFWGMAFSFTCYISVSLRFCILWLGASEGEKEKEVCLKYLI